MDDCVSSAPFVFLWGWLIRFGQALLIDTPRQLLPIVASFISSCSTSLPGCLATATGAAGALWDTAIDAPARTMQVPPDSAKAVLVFVVAISITILWPKIIQRESIPDLFGHRIASVVVLTFSFAVALYPCIASILAIPVFSETVPDISPFAKIEFRTVLELNDARKAFGDSSVRPSTPGSASPGQPARPPASEGT
jgi:hypothetical protein